MQMTGEQRIAAPRQRVWEALNDPAVLGACIPGCQTLEKEGDDRFNAVAEVKIGPIGARFKGAVTLSELDPPNGYRITGQGNGGIAGSAKGGARVALSDDAGGGTLVRYTVDAEVGGRMAQLGGPIIDATAKQMAGKFFSKFGEIVGGQADAAVAPAPVTRDSAAAPAPAESQAAAPATAPALASAHGPAPFVIPATAAPAGFPWAWAVVLAIAIVGGFLLGRSSAADWWVIAMVVLALAAAGAGFDAGRRGARR